MCEGSSWLSTCTASARTCAAPSASIAPTSASTAASAARDAATMREFYEELLTPRTTTLPIGAAFISSLHRAKALHWTIVTPIEYEADNPEVVKPSVWMDKEELSLEATCTGYSPFFRVPDEVVIRIRKHTFDDGYVGSRVDIRSRGHVADHMSVWRSGRIWLTILRSWGSKPMSSMRSASSSTRYVTRRRFVTPDSRKSMRRPGVAMTISTPRCRSPVCVRFGAPP